MIHTEIITIDGRQLRRTYSDTYMVTRDGVEYDEAVDPIDTDRVYSESTTPLPDEITAQEALDIIVGGGVRVYDTI